MAKQSAIFLYRGKSKIKPATIKKLEESGFICIAVDSLDDVNIVSEGSLNQPERILYTAALEALQDETNTTGGDIRGDYHRRVERSVRQLTKEKTNAEKSS